MLAQEKGEMKKGRWALALGLRSTARLAVALVIGLLGAGQGRLLAQAPSPAPSPGVTLDLEGTLATLTARAVSSVEATSEPEEAAGAATTAEGPGQSEEPNPTATGVLEGIVETRTPVPTGTPGPIVSGVEQLATEVGLTGTEVLGLRAPDWINLGISLLFVVASYLLGTWLIRRILPRLARRTQTGLDDALLTQAGPALRWLVVVLILQFATERLTFLGAGLRVVLQDIYFVLSLALAARILWKIIDLVEGWPMEGAVEKARADELAPVITLLVRVGRVAVVVIGATILLDHFGINVAALAALLGLGGLAFSLAARDTIADAIAGFIILVDRPFRIGDRIEIQGVGTWGDVTDIGLRTTRIRTRDNRMVIVPNSVIGANQVINYTYPDPRYRIETHVGIAYDTDVETARRVIIEAVEKVEGVLPDKPVDALYNEMGDSAMIFRVRWWIESYVDTRRVIDRVHTALQHALDEAGIESPFPIQNVNLRVRTNDLEETAHSWGGYDRRRAPRSEDHE